MRLLAADRASAYTRPDTTRNRAILINVSGAHRLSQAARFSGTPFWRRVVTRTLNGGINDDALGQTLYQPTAAERPS